MSAENLDVAEFSGEDMKSFGFAATYYIRSSLERCWEFWTQEEHLTSWLATQASIDARPGGDFIIHSALPYHSGRHRLVEVREKAFLSFTWIMDGYPSRVNVSFQPHEDGVLLSVEHLAGASPPPGIYYGFDPEALSFQRQGWDYAMGRLRCVLEDGRPDMAIPEDDRHDRVHLSIRIAAPPQAVFSALTELSALEEWEAMFTEGGLIEKHIGGRYSFGWEAEVEGGDGPNRIEEWVEGRKLVYSWFGQLPGKVSWELTEEEDGITRVDFRHTGFNQSPHEVWEYKLGWSSSLFALKWYMEWGEVCGSWIE